MSDPNSDSTPIKHMFGREMSVLYLAVVTIKSKTTLKLCGAWKAFILVDLLLKLAFMDHISLSPLYLKQHAHTTSVPFMALQENTVVSRLPPDSIYIDLRSVRMENYR